MMGGGGGVWIRGRVNEGGGAINPWRHKLTVPILVKMCRRHILTVPRRHICAAKKNFLFKTLKNKQKKWNFRWTILDISCEFQPNRSKKVAMGTNGLKYLGQFEVAFQATKIINQMTTFGCSSNLRVKNHMYSLFNVHTVQYLHR
jgi:hypothetical protein